MTFSSTVMHLLREKPVLVGLCLRLFLAWFLPLLLDGNESLLPGVSYTDIDYHVFMDAATYIQKGNSPYDRHTYRYTPFLAAFLASLPHKEFFGRLVFCVADTLCGWIILQMQSQSRTEPVRFVDYFFGGWLYNPLAINICTRGSAESFMVLLPVLVTVWIIKKSANSRKNKTVLLAFATLAGLCHGVAIHSKLYPIIYTLSFMAAFSMGNGEGASRSTKQPDTCRDIIVLWLKRLLLRPAPMLFAITAILTFLSLTALAVHFYGTTALQEGLLYHFSRVDHRHNYSMHWYWIYLGRAEQSTMMTFAGVMLLIPQLILLLYSSLAIATTNLSLALFLQTFLFVAHNKVITAQYFTWYLCLLPLSIQLTRPLQRAIILLFTTMITWLLSAYCLEMQGMAVHKIVWIASVAFFVAHVNLFGAFIRQEEHQQQARARKND